MTQKSFEIALKKGGVGERIIRNILEKKGWSIYEPVTEGAHCFDMLGIFQKRDAMAIDVKAKARMNYLPATGINRRHYEEYKRFSEKHNMPFWVLFVDEGLKTIYGNKLSELEKNVIVEGKSYPREINTKTGIIIVWALATMQTIATLNDSQVAELKSHSQRNYDFTPS